MEKHVIALEKPPRETLAKNTKSAIISSSLWNSWQIIGPQSSVNCPLHVWHNPIRKAIGLPLFPNSCLHEDRSPFHIVVRLEVIGAFNVRLWIVANHEGLGQVASLLSIDAKLLTHCVTLFYQMFLTPLEVRSMRLSNLMALQSTRAFGVFSKDRFKSGYECSLPEFWSMYLVGGPYEVRIREADHGLPASLSAIIWDSGAAIQRAFSAEYASV